MTLRALASGHWHGILLANGFSETELNGKHQPCPSCGGADRFRFIPSDPNGGFFCGDTRGDGFALLKHRFGIGFHDAAKMVERVVGKCDRDQVKKPTYAQRLRMEAKPAIRSKYLEARGLRMPPGLLWHKAVRYDDQDTYPAMLAPITRGGKFLTMHVTYLQGGKKAAVTTCRKILPGPPNNGGACELYPLAGHLGIAEGVETAIAAHMIFGMPVWAALNTSLLKTWEPPEIVTSVTIFADNDANLAGQAAAYALAHRLKLMNIEVELQIPAEPDTDWCDELWMRGLEAVRA